MLLDIGNLQLSNGKLQLPAAELRDRSPPLLPHPVATRAMHPV